MTPFARFRYWIAAPLLDELRDRLVDEGMDKQRAAYQLGKAHGELTGQQIVLNEFGRFMDERRAQSSEVTEADLERAKKGLVH